LSVGLENVEDLMADIAQALDHVHASNGKAD
jgi:cystathionine beta-lyase/cystathionine gamma-synthase